jgi:hypothetical protein
MLLESRRDPLYMFFREARGLRVGSSLQKHEHEACDLRKRNNILINNCFKSLRNSVYRHRKV